MKDTTTIRVLIDAYKTFTISEIAYHVMTGTVGGDGNLEYLYEKFKDNNDELIYLLAEVFKDNRIK